MKIFDVRPTNNHQWENYKDLELIPDSNPTNYSTEPDFFLGIDSVWLTLINLLLDELVDEQRVEYLERCLQLEEAVEPEKDIGSTLKNLWRIMN